MFVDDAYRTRDELVYGDILADRHPSEPTSRIVSCDPSGRGTGIDRRCTLNRFALAITSAPFLVAN